MFNFKEMRMDGEVLETFKLEYGDNLDSIPQGEALLIDGSVWAFQLGGNGWNVKWLVMEPNEFAKVMDGGDVSAKYEGKTAQQIINLMQRVGE